jgi:ferric-dicitrate binding protein FerR (iron transport regulator)
MDNKLLEKFFSGLCSEEEHHKIKAWFLSGEADEVLSEKMEAYWKQEEKKSTDHWGREALFGLIHKRIEESAPPRKSISLPERIVQNRWKYWSYAAAVALLIGFGGGWYIHHVKTAIAPLSNQINYISKQTVKGEKRTVLLPDGTVVTLNAESRLRYGENFGKAPKREIYLEGEAFLEVAKNPHLPFQIHTGPITTTVLGTSFNIQAFDKEEITISVVSGKVKVAGKNDPLQTVAYLSPGEAAYIKKDSILGIRKFDYPQVLSWKEGTLYFKNARFSDIITTLERWYGVEIRVQRKGIEDGFSGAYTHKSLERVLEGMSFVLDFDYTINDRLITIK